MGSWAVKVGWCSSIWVVGQCKWGSVSWAVKGGALFLQVGRGSVQVGGRSYHPGVLEQRLTGADYTETLRNALEAGPP